MKNVLLSSFHLLFLILRNLQVVSVHWCDGCQEYSIQNFAFKHEHSCSGNIVLALFVPSSLLPIPPSRYVQFIFHLFSHFSSSAPTELLGANPSEYLVLPTATFLTCGKCNQEFPNHSIISHPCTASLTHISISNQSPTALTYLHSQSLDTLLSKIVVRAEFRFSLWYLSVYSFILVAWYTMTNSLLLIRHSSRHILPNWLSPSLALPKPILSNWLPA